MSQFSLIIIVAHRKHECLIPRPQDHNNFDNYQNLANDTFSNPTRTSKFHEGAKKIGKKIIKIQVSSVDN